MFSTSTAITSVTDAITAFGLVVAGVVATILALWAALAGLGWGVRKVRQYLSGRKF